jgi:hypothetical protein
MIRKNATEAQQSASQYYVSNAKNCALTSETQLFAEIATICVSKETCAQRLMDALGASPPGMNFCFQYLTPQHCRVYFLSFSTATTNPDSKLNPVSKC